MLARMPPTEIEKALNALVEVISLSVSCGEKVSIRNFGKFQPRSRSAVTRKNPKTGVSHDIPERFTVGFVPSPVLKNRLNPPQ